MRRTAPTTLVILLLLHGTHVLAQQPGLGGGYRNPATVGRPTFSPYLNLLRGGNPTLNYYGLVRPQVQLRQGQVQLSDDYRALRREFATNPGLQIENSNLGPTGHVSYYNRDRSGSLDRLQNEMTRRRELTRQLGPIRGSRLGATGHHTMSGQDRRYFGQPR